MDSFTIGRRQALATLGLGAAGLAGVASAQETSPYPITDRVPEQLGWDPRRQEYVLPELPYRYDALEPNIDAETMKLHYTKHHARYVRGLNGAVEALAQIRSGQRPESEIKHWSQQLAFNGSGHFLHCVFWYCMSPNGGGQPRGEIGAQINRDFGSFKAFADQFRAAAIAVEGSGWGLLVFEPVSHRLMVMEAEKHQNLTAWGVVPIVVVDVWEHAYYLKYQNRRKDYVNAFMNVIDWDFADGKLAGVRQVSG